MGSPPERRDVLEGPASIDKFKRECDLYEENPSYTDTLVDFRTWIEARTAAGALDLSQREDGRKLIVWLNQWGCRLPTANRDHYDNTLRGLRTWWPEFEGRLADTAPLMDYAELEDWSEETHGGPARPKDLATRFPRVTDLIDVFEGLREQQLGSRCFGPVAASKTLFVLRPDLFVAWDNPMMNALGYRGGSGARYARFLNDVRERLERVQVLCRAQDYDIEELPKKLGERHRACTPPELVNKELWVRTRPQAQDRPEGG